MVSLAVSLVDRMAWGTRSRSVLSPSLDEFGLRIAVCLTVYEASDMYLGGFFRLFHVGWLAVSFCCSGFDWPSVFSWTV